jgi:dolichol-phosphate mannosyltransferase
MSSLFDPMRDSAAESLERKLISIVVPVYNEEGNIDPLYEAVTRVLAEVRDRYDYEFVFTDNHSEDNTFAELTRLASRDPKVRVFRFSRNFGFQRSIYTGYMQAAGDAAIQIDCDPGRRVRRSFTASAARASKGSSSRTHAASSIA